jgi:hypothetical protein
VDGFILWMHAPTLVIEKVKTNTPKGCRGGRANGRTIRCSQELSVGQWLLRIAIGGCEKNFRWEDGLLTHPLALA